LVNVLLLAASLGVAATGLCFARHLPVLAPLCCGICHQPRSAFKVAVLFALGKLPGYLVTAIVGVSAMLILPSSIALAVLIALTGLWIAYKPRVLLYILGKPNPTPRPPFLLGLLTGLTPCPLLLAIMPVAASESLWTIVAAVLVFWVVTLPPILVVSVASASVTCILVKRSGEEPVVKVAGLTLLILGLLMALAILAWSY